MRRLVTTATLTLLLTAGPASSALAADRGTRGDTPREPPGHVEAGDPMEEPEEGSGGEDSDDEVRDRQPVGEDEPARDGDDTGGEEPDADEDKAADEPVECAEPEVSRSYTAEAMVVTADIDLRGCDWWDGSSLNLVGVIGRDDGSGDMDGNVAFQAVTCTDEARLRHDPDPGWRVTGCAIEVVLPHPPAEVAYYYGGISFTWEDGPHRIDLDTTCTSWTTGTVCRDEFAPAVRGPGIRT